MSLTRGQLLTIVAGELDDVLTLASMTSGDDVANFKGPIDRTFRALGTAEASLGSATVADGAEQQAIAYATYFVLSRAVMALPGKMNVKAGSASANLREQFENLRDRMKEALAIAQGFGLPIRTDGTVAAPMPYGGGISKGDRDAINADGDRVPPLFSSDDLKIPGIDGLGSLDTRWTGIGR